MCVWLKERKRERDVIVTERERYKLQTAGASQPTCTSIHNEWMGHSASPQHARSSLVSSPFRVELMWVAARTRLPVCQRQICFGCQSKFLKKKCATDSSCTLMFSSLNLLVPTTNGPFLSWSVFAKVLHALQNIDSISSSNTSHSRSRPWSSFFHADWNFLWRVCLSYCLNRSADWFSPDLTFFLGGSMLDK